MLGWEKNFRWNNEGKKYFILEEVVIEVYLLSDWYDLM